MTDNDITKALECCSEDNCYDCPLSDMKIECLVTLPKATLGLIKRQQEDLAAKDETITNLIEQIKTFRADTIKEFSERLKRHIELYEHAEDLHERQAYENGDTAGQQIHQYAENLLGHLLEYIEELERENEDNH